MFAYFHLYKIMCTSILKMTLLEDQIEKNDFRIFCQIRFQKRSYVFISFSDTPLVMDF